MEVGQRFRDSEEYELLEPYATGDGLVAGYHVEGLLSRDPWRHTTYEARMADGRRVALKLLSVRSDDSRRLTKRFERLIRLRASIEHPNLLPILDWGKMGDRYYLAMPLCRARTLADLFKAAPLEANGALELLGQLADALETAHERGLVHRDLAPEHVLVESRGDGGHVLLGDFGVGDPEGGSGLPGMTGATPYLSPEKLKDEPLAPESNVYSLACMLVEALTGSPPYTFEDAGIVAYAHVGEPPPRLSERQPDLPASIDDVVAAAMAKDRRERLVSARQLVSAAAVSLGVQVPRARVDGSPELATGGGLPARGTSGDAGLRPQPSEPGQGAERPSLRRRLPLGSAFRAFRALPALPARKLLAAARRGALPLALAATVACAGALGFILARSGDDATREASTREAATSSAAAERERNSILRATDVALERLDARRAAARRRLASARTRRTRAAEARRLVTAYEVAGRNLPRGTRERARVASALSEAERAYARLARAARRADRRRYAAAARAVRRSEGDLNQAILRLNRAAR